MTSFVSKISPQYAPAIRDALDACATMLTEHQKISDSIFNPSVNHLFFKHPQTSEWFKKGKPHHQLDPALRPTRADFDRLAKNLRGKMKTAPHDLEATIDGLQWLEQTHIALLQLAVDGDHCLVRAFKVTKPLLPEEYVDEVGTVPLRHQVATSESKDEERIEMGLFAVDRSRSSLASAGGSADAVLQSSLKEYKIFLKDIEADKKIAVDLLKAMQRCRSISHHLDIQHLNVCTALGLMDESERQKEKNDYDLHDRIERSSLSISEKDFTQASSRAELSDIMMRRMPSFKTTLATHESRLDWLLVQLNSHEKDLEQRESRIANPKEAHRQFDKYENVYEEYCESVVLLSDAIKQCMSLYDCAERSKFQNARAKG